MNLSIQKKDEAIDFVELNITGDTVNYNRCDEESLYINSMVFNVFADCFERSNHLFDHMQPTAYNSRHFIALKNELSSNLYKLLDISNMNDFWGFMASQHMGQKMVELLGGDAPEGRKRWRRCLRHLIRDNNYITRLIDRCIEQNLVLWVIPF
ncbi:MAG: hypothetical protein IJU72_03615 [Bacteroidales bacterium]|nr:hypothetical protein [Bacteroidales bacterium]